MPNIFEGSGTRYWSPNLYSCPKSLYWWFSSRFKYNPIRTATTKTINCGGIAEMARSFFLIVGHRASKPRLKRPIDAIAGLASEIICGISASSSNGSCLSVETPNALGICLAMMITPMAESMPCMADLGKNSLRIPARNSPKRICRTAAATPTAKQAR